MNKITVWIAADDEQGKDYADFLVSVQNSYDEISQYTYEEFQAASVGDDEDGLIIEMMDGTEIRISALIEDEDDRQAWRDVDQRSWFRPIILDEKLHDVMTASEVAQEFGLAEPTVRQAINRGQIMARKSGGTWLVLRSDAQAQWEQQKREISAHEIAQDAISYAEDQRNDGEFWVDDFEDVASLTEKQLRELAATYVFMSKQENDGNVSDEAETEAIEIVFAKFKTFQVWDTP